MIKSFRDLAVWGKGMVLVEDIYKTTNSFPKEEMFGLTNQMRRASVSIPSNIAEGWMKQHRKEYIQSLHYALGSCGELETQVIIACNLKYLDIVTKERVVSELHLLSKMLWTLVKRLRE